MVLGFVLAGEAPLLVWPAAALFSQPLSEQFQENSHSDYGYTHIGMIDGNGCTNSGYGSHYRSSVAKDNSTRGGI